MPPDASCPKDRWYHPEHDWARIDPDDASIATFGITWFAQDALGEIVFFSGPERGATVRRNDPYAELESVKAVSDIIAPLSGEVIDVNGTLGDAPETVNSAPYDDGWLVKVRLTDPDEVGQLLSAEDYEVTL